MTTECAEDSVIRFTSKAVNGNFVKLCLCYEMSIFFYLYVKYQVDWLGNKEVTIYSTFTVSEKHAKLTTKF